MIKQWPTTPVVHEHHSKDVLAGFVDWNRSSQFISRSSEKRLISGLSEGENKGEVQGERERYSINGHTISSSKSNILQGLKVGLSESSALVCPHGLRTLVPDTSGNIKV